MSEKLLADYNPIDKRWKVLDKDGFVFGDGRTIEEAIGSARDVTNKPIWFNGSCLDGGE